MYLVQGLLLGLTAGLSPGPLLGLLLSQTLRRGWRAGMIVALAPLVTDAAIVALALLVLGHLPPWALHLVSLLGGLVVIYLGIESMRTVKLQIPGSVKEDTSRHVLFLAIITNLLNPHPYIFWATVGGSLLFRSFLEGGLLVSCAFTLSLYAMIIGTKMMLALLISRGQKVLTESWYRLALRGSGLFLLLLGALLVWEGLQALWR